MSRRSAGLLDDLPLPLIAGAGLILVGGLYFMSTSRGSGWSKANSGIVINDRSSTFLGQLAAKLPFRIVVTSGVRTAEGQARAMMAMADLGASGLEQMKKNYDDGLVATLLALPKDLAAWTAEVTKAYGDGRLARGGHYDGGAVDLRTRDLSESQIAQLEAAVKSLGGSTWREGAPPHLHVNLPKSQAVT